MAVKIIKVNDGESHLVDDEGETYVIKRDAEKKLIAERKAKAAPPTKDKTVDQELSE